MIVSGRSGKRLWPLSTEKHPKQFATLDQIRTKTLVQNIYERLISLAGLEKPTLIDKKWRKTTFTQNATKFIP